jgi:fluoroacetyl-CoA thioesterase
MTIPLSPGLEFEFNYTVPENKTVPALYPEADEFQRMPRVFATGFMVGFIEWACIRALVPYLDWPRQQTVGTHINVSHVAATPVGMAVSARVRLIEVDGKRLSFEVEARDEIDVIGRGTHERFIIDFDRFNQRVQKKVGRIRR